MKKNKLISPFLKWVGGKRQLIPEITKYLPKNYSYYFEPFVGAGALLFYLQPNKAIINDSNEELINVYRVIKEKPNKLIDDLKKHKNESEYFYTIRALDRSSDFENITDVNKASRIIYLNKTCYNGLYRVNNSGQFNSPYGRYKNPNIVNEPTIKAVSKFLNNNDIKILNTDFEKSLDSVDKNSFVYFDPPYHPISNSSNFTGYVEGGFDIFEQVRLRDLCDRLTEKNIKFMLSNSHTQFIKDIYSNYKIVKVRASRSINSNSKKRGDIDEVLIKNYE